MLGASKRERLEEMTIHSSKLFPSMGNNDSPSLPNSNEMEKASMLPYRIRSIAPLPKRRGENKSPTPTPPAPAAENGLQNNLLLSGNPPMGQASALASQHPHAYAPQHRQPLASVEFPPRGPAQVSVDDLSTQSLDAVALQRLLLELQIVNKAEWDAARAAATSDDPIRILWALAEIPSSRDGEDGPSYVLTQFQMQMVLSGHARRLRIEHYLLLDLIGQGGMAKVYKAYNLRLNQIEAVKTLAPSDEGGADAVTRKRFLREARLLVKLRHPRFPIVYDAGFENETHFIAMEYVRGRTMREVVEEAVLDGKNLPVWWVADKIVAAARGLGHAHTCGIIHRDITHKNLMITDDNQLKVLDLGIAKLMAASMGPVTSQNLTRNNMGLGTLGFMPPEQLNNARVVTPAADIFSLGVSFFYALTGHLPFGTELEEVVAAFSANLSPRVSQHRGDVPRSLVKVIARMMELRPEDRYPSVNEVIRAIEPFTRPPAPRWQTLGNISIRTVAIVSTVACAAALTFYRPNTAKNSVPLYSPQQEQGENSGDSAKEMGHEMGTREEYRQGETSAVTVLRDTDSPLAKRGRELIAEGDFVGAIAEFLKAVGQDPENQTLHLRSAAVASAAHAQQAMDRADYAIAVQAYSQSRIWDPNQNSYRTGLVRASLEHAKALTKAGRTTSAIAAYENSIRWSREPELTREARLAVGQLYQQLALQSRVEQQASPFDSHNETAANPTPHSSGHEPTNHGTRWIEIVNDRCEVMVGANVITVVKRGERFAVSETNGPWLAINIPEQVDYTTGWVHQDEARSVTADYIEVTAENATLMDRSKTVGRVAKGKRLRVQQANGPWYLVTAENRKEGVSGWVHRDQVRNVNH